MLKKIWRFFIRATLWFLLLSVFWVLLYKFVDVPYTPLMAIRSIDSVDNYEIKHNWISIEEISPQMQLAVICAEDQHFLNHSGFDMKSIKKAYKSNKEGNRIRGASTISQQTAKNVFLWPQRSWLRKGLETYFTFLIELFWSKERILEVYLNSIEMGNGVFGVDAAANHWFNKSANRLNKFESAAIAAILPNPIKSKAEPRTAYIERRKNWILKQMDNFGPYSLKKAE